MDVYERFVALEETVQRLIQPLTNLGLFNNNPIEGQPQIKNPRTQEDKTLKIDIHKFDGLSYKLEHYINWESRMDQYFEFKETPKETIQTS